MNGLIYLNIIILIGGYGSMGLCFIQYINKWNTTPWLNFFVICLVSGLIAVLKKRKDR